MFPIIRKCKGSQFIDDPKNLDTSPKVQILNFRACVQNFEIVEKLWSFVLFDDWKHLLVPFSCGLMLPNLKNIEFS